MFLVIKEEDFSSCSHTIQKTLNFPPYLFLYDCFAIRKIQNFQFFFPYVLAKELVSFCDDLPFFSTGKKEGKMN
jgi:hypothetical protein